MYMMVSLHNLHFLIEIFGWVGSLVQALSFLCMFDFLPIYSTRYLGSIPWGSLMRESEAAGNALMDITDAVGSLNQTLCP